jgi:hypothetical protein
MEKFKFYNGQHLGFFEWKQLIQKQTKISEKKLQ